MKSDRSAGFVTDELAYLRRRVAELEAELLSRNSRKGEQSDSQRSYRVLFQNLQNGFALCRVVRDGEGRPAHYIALEVNEALTEGMGANRAQVVGRDLAQALEGIRQTEPPLLEFFNRVADSGRSEMLDVYVKPSDRWYEVTLYSPNRDRLALTLSDITRRRNEQRQQAARREELERLVAERTGQLEAANRQLTDLLDALPAATFLTDTDGIVLTGNRAVAERLGLAVSDLPGLDAFSRGSNEVVERRRKLMREVVATGRPVHFEDGRDGLHLYNVFTPLCGTDGRVGRVAVVSMDVSTRYAAEDARRQTLSLLEKSNAELQQFLYAASHDLQEPVRTISSFLQLLFRKYQPPDDPSAREYIAFIHEAAARLREMIDGLLTLSRIETRGRPFFPVEMDTLLDQTLRSRRAAFEMAGAEITRDPLPTVAADACQIGLLLDQLLDNALKFRRPGPTRLHLGCRPDGDRWEFSLRDNGIGFDMQYHERIFVVFQRLHTRQEYPGNGLGLAICRKIVERHGGRIWAESDRDTGSVFRFTLPAGPSPHSLPAVGGNDQISS